MVDVYLPCLQHKTDSVKKQNNNKDMKKKSEDCHYKTHQNTKYNKKKYIKRIMFSVFNTL